MGASPSHDSNSASVKHKKVMLH